MERREFFADRPLWLRSIPALAIVLLLFVPIVFLQIHGAVGPSDSGFRAGALSFAFTTAIGGAGLLVVLLLLLVKAKRMNIPLLALDERGLKTPIIQFAWPLIRDAWVGRVLGLPVLCISTINDDAVMKRIPALFRLRYALRRRIVGAPMVLPAMRGISLQEVCDLIAEYRAYSTQHPAS